MLLYCESSVEKGGIEQSLRVCERRIKFTRTSNLSCEQRALKNIHMASSENFVSFPLAGIWLYLEGNVV